MADTHINAFYGAVDEAKAEVVQANGKLAAAEAALKAHPDYKEEEVKVESPKKPKQRDSKGHFVK